MGVPFARIQGWSCAVLLALQAWPGVAQERSEGAASTAAPLHTERRVPLSFSRAVGVNLLTLDTSKQELALQRVYPSADEAAARGAVVAGALTAWVLPTGSRLLNRTTGMTQFAAALTSRVVRPQAPVADAAHDAVWFYGEALYRYRIATGELHRFEPASRALGLIRKAVAVSAGLWLATDRGAFFFDDASETFRSVAQASDAPLVNAAVVGKSVWFADERARLIELEPDAAGSIGLAMSAKLPCESLAEMHGTDDGLWLLLSVEHGDGYRVAYVAGKDRLNVLSGRYFSLRKQGERLVAAEHSKRLVIDPVTRNASMDDAATAAKVGRPGEVVFLGSSYSVKDPSEVVQRRPLDLSRGWATALRQELVRE
jgi:hypothetical protein